eukprot:scaffold119201_cov57-Attheya_sp.AAC.4
MTPEGVMAFISRQANQFTGKALSVWHHWKSACFTEYDKNSKANLFNKPLLISQIPPDTQVYRYVIQPKVKSTDNTDMWQFIACHCANGPGIQKVIDYVESYHAPVTTSCSICIVVSLVAGRNMKLAITDVKNAFQNTMIPVSEHAHLTMLLYYYLQLFRCCKYLNVIITPLKAEADKYCLQSMNVIQGMKPAGHQWNNILTNVLQQDQTQIICVSTDDFLCAAFTHQHLFDDLCTSLKKYFELTTKEGPKLTYHTLNIEQNSHYISIDQTAHIQEIVDAWFPPVLVRSMLLLPNQHFKVLKCIARYLVTQTHKPFYYPKNNIPALASSIGRPMKSGSYSSSFVSHCPTAL